MQVLDIHVCFLQLITPELFSTMVIPMNLFQTISMLILLWWVYSHLLFPKSKGILSPFVKLLGCFSPPLAWIWNQVQQLKAKKKLHCYPRLPAEHGEWFLEDGVPGEFPSYCHDHERSGKRKGKTRPQLALGKILTSEYKSVQFLLIYQSIYSWNVVWHQIPWSSGRCWVSFF